MLPFGDSRCQNVYALLSPCAMLLDMTYLNKVCKYDNYSAFEQYYFVKGILLNVLWNYLFGNNLCRGLAFAAASSFGLGCRGGGRPFLSP